MEALFLAAICGCNAGFLREVLHKIYIPRIHRENASFAGNVLGSQRGVTLGFGHFFEHGRWDLPVESGVEGQSLNAEDQLFILRQAGLYLTATRGSQYRLDVGDHDFCLDLLFNHPSGVGLFSGLIRENNAKCIFIH
jgi:hypothetical protein